MYLPSDNDKRTLKIYFFFSSIELWKMWNKYETTGNNKRSLIFHVEFLLTDTDNS